MELASIKNRDQIPDYLLLSGLNGIGVEVGTWKAGYSEKILSRSNLSRLYSVDPWKLWPDNLYPDCQNVSQYMYDQAMQTAIERLNKFGYRSQIIRKASNEASELFDNGQLDFVYIDANHKYVRVTEDLKLWYPKLKRGGLMVGHDYMHGIYNIDGYHVYIEMKPAVDKFVSENDRSLFITDELWPSWMFRK